jgi:hypothetical protein
LRNLDVAFADSLGERLVAVYPASPSKDGRGHETGTTAAYIDDARVLDTETRFAKRGAEFGRRKRRWRRLR